MSNTPVDFGLDSAGVGISSELGTHAPAETVGDIINVFLGLLGIVMVFGMIITWIYGLIDAITRNNLKENKMLWIILMIFAGPIGTVVYGFMEGRKKLAYWTIGVYVGYIVILVGWAIATFVISSL